ncbi:hypothetical protein UFOVP1169_17 [uncultured Caudovirales phage]|uniref:Terminase n=1 Tax=uncultured Caudovirales phage TaxID=2100421 RepID=A0A6J5QT79_9CAUD|nr:hypothetical protein UFOVP1169_17 [uncultured Caudovirales phage]
MANIVIPHNWIPRDYQLRLWGALENGAKRAIYTFHRRAGKDEVGLHWTATQVVQRVGGYWYMLPMASQARKAIWEAVNPHTGKRRIDEAFPLALREVTRENEMFIRFKNGSTWQVVGSDNYNSLIGSPPVGVVFSEWSLSNPAAWAYLRPIFRENGGWALFNFTPRGRNHAVTMFEGAEHDPDWFCQKLTARQTGVFSEEDLAKELAEYIRDYGLDEGTARFNSEYMCSFDEAIPGSFFGTEMTALEQAGRLGVVDYDPALPVYTSWDLGWTDDTAIWFFQLARMEVRFIDYYAASGETIAHFARVLQDRRSRLNTPYAYGKHYLPWDARPATLASEGRSILQQLAAFVGIGNIEIVPNLDDEDQIQATRVLLPRVWIDGEKCADGINSLRSFHRKWDADRRVFSKKYEHDWASHGAKSFGYAAVAYKSQNPNMKNTVFRTPTWDEMIEGQQVRGVETRIG